MKIKVSLSTQKRKLPYSAPNWWSHDERSADNDTYWEPIKLRARWMDTERLRNIINDMNRELEGDSKLERSDLEILKKYFEAELNKRG